MKRTNILFFSLVIIFLFCFDCSVYAEEEYDDDRKRIDLQSAWDKGLTGKGVKIAIIDSGIKEDHPDLEGNIAGGISCIKYEKTSNEEFPYKCIDDSTKPWNEDIVGHGTEVAGIIGAKHNGKGIKGIAPNSEIYAVRVKDQIDLSPPEATAAAIYWAIENKMDIVNISMGSEIKNEAREEAVKKAHEAGLLLVISAGNEGLPDESLDNVSYPGRDPEPITVGGFYNIAISQNVAQGDYRCAVEIPDFFDVDGLCFSSGPAVDIAAPVRIYTTNINGDYKQSVGTSFSTPMVAGVAALLMEQFPDYSRDQIRELLLQNADYIPGYTDETGHNWEFGAGSVQATPIKITNPRFSLWKEEMERKSVNTYPGTEILESSTKDIWKKRLYNGYQGYSLDFPSYFFVDNKQPEKYVRFFFHDFKIEITHYNSTSSEKRQKYIDDFVKKLPDGKTVTMKETNNENVEITRTRYAIRSGLKNDLTEKVTDLVNTPQGVYVFDLTTSKDNIKDYGTDHEIVKREVLLDDMLGTFSLQPIEGLPKTTNTSKVPIGELSTTDYALTLPENKYIFGLYSREDLQNVQSTVEKKETELKTKFGSETIKAFFHLSDTFSYDSYKSDYFTDEVKKIVQKNKVPIVDLEMGYNPWGYDSEGILKGNYDGSIESWAKNLKNINAPIFIRLGSGMNGSFRNFSATENQIGEGEKYTWDPDQYKLAYRYIVDKFRDNDAYNVQFVWSPNAESIPNNFSNMMEMYYPGDFYVDWINIQGANIDGTGDLNLGYQIYVPKIQAKTQTFDEVFDKTYQELRRLYPNKPMMMEVTSLNRDNSKTSFVQDMFQKLPSKYPNVRILTWFNGREYSYLYSDMDVSLPLETKNIFTSNLGTSSTFFSNTLAQVKKETITLERNLPLYTNPDFSTKTAYTIGPGQVYSERRIGDWYWVAENEFKYGWVNLKDPTYNKDIYVLQDLTNLYDEPNGTKGSLIDSQSVFATEKMSDSEGKIWYKIQTWAGLKYITLKPHQVFEGKKFPITLTKQTYMYADVYKNSPSLLGIQTLTAVNRNGDWSQIETWKGLQWINTKENYALLGTVKTVNQPLVLKTNVEMYYKPFDMTDPALKQNTGTWLTPQTVTEKERWTEPDPRSDGKFITWHKIGTYAGDMWVKQ